MHEWHLADRIVCIGRRPLIMGILNVTPDSFSDGGKHAVPAEAIAFGLELVRQGADLIDIGGESSRPGAVPVSAEEELGRVLPVVAGLAGQVSVPLSVDTTKAAVARSCLSAGARIVNDITGLTGDPGMPEVVREAGAGVIVMHMQGTPATMQDSPTYEDVVAEISSFFESRLRCLAEQGIASERIVLDPGIGFGKTADHNLTILARLAEFQRLGRPVCLGLSRKRFLGKMLDRPVDRRLAGSLAVVCQAMTRNAVQVVRVHDVAETRDAVEMVAVIEGHAV